jgi:hypothetical protein
MEILKAAQLKTLKTFEPNSQAKMAPDMPAARAPHGPLP